MRWKLEINLDDSERMWSCVSRRVYYDIVIECVWAPVVYTWYELWTNRSLLRVWILPQVAERSPEQSWKSWTNPKVYHPTPTSPLSDMRDPNWCLVHIIPGTWYKYVRISIPGCFVSNSSILQHIMHTRASMLITSTRYYTGTRYHVPDMWVLQDLVRMNVPGTNRSWSGWCNSSEHLPLEMPRSTFTLAPAW